MGMSDKRPKDDDVLYTRIGRDAKPHEVMLQQAARIAQLGYFVFNVRTSMVEVCSARHAAIFGMTPAEFVQNATGLDGEMRMIHPDDRNMVREAYGRLLAGDTIEMEYRFYRPDGSLGHIREVVAPDCGKEGQIVRGLGSSVDVTDSRRAEERRAQAGRLEALGELTAGVAHDFNNILAIVMGNAELLQLGPLGSDPDGLLDDIVAAAKRGGALTQSLLNFAQKAVVRPVLLDLGEEVSKATALFERTMLQKARLSVSNGPDALPIFADPDKLQSVIINILINARDAIPAGGAIEVTTREAPAPEGGETAAANPPGYACLTIRDDGAGIPAQVLPRVTEPFFTTKPRAQGSGLGLAMAAGFMRQLGGDLVIDSTVGTGTEVRLFFPFSLHKEAGARQQATAKPMHTTPRHVLLLEDEPPLRSLFTRNLKTWGFDVTATGTSAEALDALSDGPYDLALLDNYVPGSYSGADIATRIKTDSPNTVTILLTGLATLQDHTSLEAVDLVLAKPIASSTLRAKIAETLASRSTTAKTASPPGRG